MSAAHPAGRPAPSALSVFYLAATVGCGLGFNVLVVPWDAWQPGWVLLVLIAVFGLPHGALDPLLAHRAGLWRTPPGAVVTVLAYLALVGLMLGFWRGHTATALGLFLLITAWHFSRDWRGRRYPGVGWVAVALLLGLPALAHPQVIVDLFALLVAVETARWFQIGLAVLGALALPLAALVAWRISPVAPGCALELAALGLGGFLVPPVWFFVLYFCILHSPRHVVRHFAADARRHRRRLLVVALAFSLPVIAAAVGYASSVPEARLTEGYARILFAGLFALTVPHVLLVEWVEHRNSHRTAV